MYIPNYFKNENLEEVKEFVANNSFGILMSEVEGRITGTHIPMELDINKSGENILLGHLAKANPQSKDLWNNKEVLAIFTGPHGYVSSSWYQKENVPTWNYIAVHIYGKVKILDDKELLDSLRKLVDTYEVHSKDPVSVDTMSGRTLRQVNGIVGFSIKITEIQAAYKLSQNRNEMDFHNITKELKSTGNPSDIAVAKEMEKRMK
jgi:transcriptional regulator